MVSGEHGLGSNQRGLFLEMAGELPMDPSTRWAGLFLPGAPGQLGGTLIEWEGVKTITCDRPIAMLLTRHGVCIKNKNEKICQNCPLYIVFP